MKIEHLIHINAPQEVVWAVTVDIEHWPEWTPSVEKIKRIDQGLFDVGSTARIKQPQLPEAEWRVTSLIPGKQFTWESRIRGIRVIATHEIIAAEAGTSNVLRVHMPGLMALLLWPLMRSSVRRSLEQENTGLKSRCEAGGS